MEISCRRGLAWSLILLLSYQIQCSSGTRNSEMAEILQRPIRAVAYPSNSNMGIFLALAVPLADPFNSVSLSYFFEANYVLPDNASVLAEPAAARTRRSIDRATVYAVVRNKFESAGFPGHGCLLRSICETSERPLEHNGVLGDVLRVVFTPSSSRPEQRLPDGVVEAELRGRNASCADYYAACPLGLYDLIATLQ